MIRRLRFIFLIRFTEAKPIFESESDFRGTWHIQSVNALEACWDDALRYGWRIALLNFKWTVIRRNGLYNN